jgi:CRISPR/Cas system Type II protein with McrA/HNH and RuvC-like nuclease domain
MDTVERYHPELKRESIRWLLYRCNCHEPATCLRQKGLSNVHCKCNVEMTRQSSRMKARTAERLSGNRRNRINRFQKLTDDLQVHTFDFALVFFDV